jgi:hypothetical protein
LSEYLNSFVKLLDSSLNLFKGAAGSIDEMKTKVMNTYSVLNDKKKEELATVKATVKTELKSSVDIYIPPESVEIRGFQKTTFPILISFENPYFVDLGNF